MPTGWAEVSWAVSGNPVSTGVSTGSPQQQPDKKFRLSSFLTIQTSEWTSGKDVSCQVAGAGSKASKSIKQSDCSTWWQGESLEQLWPVSSPAWLTLERLNITASGVFWFVFKCFKDSKLFQTIYVLYLLESTFFWIFNCFVLIKGILSSQFCDYIYFTLPWLYVTAYPISSGTNGVTDFLMKWCPLHRK